ncbi:MAG: metal-dependent hydrolase [Thermoprotei archaeon]|nr:MAG: metal-dependent hydrolase [Thermoprotei archaeon]RLF19882.1 MAG: metal-dependent hydrolase [Thermoprotei archaeon]
MVRIRWLGHATFLIRFGEKKIIVDPWITGNPVCPIKLEELERVDHVVVTHSHGDHLGDAIEIAKRDSAKLIAIYEIAKDAEEKGVKNVVGGNIGGWIEVDGIKYMLTPALHSSEKGAPTGVIMSNGSIAIYHAGDTGLFSEMELLGRMYKIDVALLPIGGVYTMGPYEASIATFLLRPKIVIPMHYNTFPAITQDPETFKEYVKRVAPGVNVRILKPGEEVEIRI